MGKAEVLLSVNWFITCAGAIYLGVVFLHTGMDLYSAAAEQAGFVASLMNADTAVKFDALLRLSHWLTQL